MQKINPSSRYSHKARFLVRIGDGFIVSSSCLKLDSPYGYLCNDPESWFIELCAEAIRMEDPNDGPAFKTFIVEIYVKDIKHAKELDGTLTLAEYLKKEREKRGV